MFWFLVALVIFIVWMDERAGLKKKIGQSYSQGVTEGRRLVSEQIKELLARGENHIEAARLRAIVGGEAPLPPAQSQTEQLAVLEEGINTVYAPEYEAEYGPDVSAAPELQPELTLEDIEAEKARRTTSNLNAMLYVGSFLIVAAAALFVNLTMPAFIKLLAVLLVTAAFYSVGLVLYAKSTRLRSAAIAFVGTGLAILPFVGFALRSLGGLSNESAWLLTSAVGLVAYGVAALYLRSQLVSYITMAFLLSLALSTVSSLSLGVLWYFIVLIGVSIVLNTIHYVWPRLVPSIFAVPIEQTSKITTPIALVASLFVYQSMELFMYEVLFGIATLHYAIVWLQSRETVYEVATRVVAHITVLLFASDASQKMGGKNGAILFGIIWLIAATVQIVYSALRADRNNEKSVRRESIFIGVMFGLMLLIIPIWIAADNPARWAAGHLALMGALSAAVSLRLRKVEWSYIGLVASVVVPVIVALAVFEPSLPAWALALVFAASGAVSLVVLDQLKDNHRSKALEVFLAACTLTYAGCVAIAGIASYESSTLGWTMAVSAGLVVLLSYTIKAVAFEVVGAIIGIGSVVGWVNWLLVEPEWQLLVSVVISAALLMGAVFAHHTKGERTRRDALAVLGAIVVAGLIGAVGSGSIAVLRTAVVLLVAAGIGMLALRIALANKRSIVANLALAGYVGYPTLALLAAFDAGSGWTALVAIALAGILWAGSYVEKQPVIVLAGNAFLVIGLAILWTWLSFDGEWLVHGVAWLSAVIFYLMYWFSQDRHDRPRQDISLISVLAVLGFAAVWGMFAPTTAMVIASAGSLLIASAIVALHGYTEQKNEYVEAALYAATFALQRIVSMLVPSANIVFYGHWWAAVLFMAALWRKDSRVRPIVGLSFVTVTTGIYALMGVAGYSLFFLVEHLVVAGIGALTRKQWAMWWGIAAVIVAVLYFLRNYTVAALLFLGFLIILFVVWRLMKSGNKDS